jgi:hypothetical protein
MQLPACTLLLLCFLVSTVSVPKADFSLITQLPALHHCKATEDPDFITDHLLNSDGLFGQHVSTDNQKRHQPFQFHRVRDANTFVGASLQMNINEPLLQLNDFKFIKDTDVHSGYIAHIFHPPATDKTTTAT